MFKKIIDTILGISFIGVLTLLLSLLPISNSTAIARSDFVINWWFLLSVPLIYLIWTNFKVTRVNKFFFWVISSTVGYGVNSLYLLEYVFDFMGKGISIFWIGTAALILMLITPVIQIITCYILAYKISQNTKGVE